VAVALTDDRLILKIEAEGRKLGQPFTVVASARGRPRYDPELQAFLFEADNVTIEKLTIRGGTVAEKADDVAARLKGRLGEVLKDSASKIGASATGLAEQGIKYYLAAYPIYRLKDDAKGLVVRTVLRTLAIENGALVVTVSLWGITLSGFGWGLLLLMVAVSMVQLARHPGWGRSSPSGGR
jgi:hypothetical protein